MRERIKDKDRLQHILDAIEGMRHVLVHGYYEISPDKVWNVIEKDLPILRPKIQDLLGK